MEPKVELLQGELERLFSDEGIVELCTQFMGIDSEDLGLFDESKAVFVRRLLGWCQQQHATQALVDAVIMSKNGQVDQGVKNLYETRSVTADVGTGTELDEFIVGDKISDGELGAVYRCDPVDSSQHNCESGYGLKVIHWEHTLNPNATQRFKTLMRYLKQDFGSGLQKVVSVGDLEDGRPYVVSEWTEGFPATEILPLDVIDALNVLESVVDSLEPIHEIGLIHSDINTGNIIVREVPSEPGEKWDVTLLGFGVDRLLHRPGTAISNAKYCGRFSGVAPEQAKGLEPTPLSDIYALGAMLFEMLAGEPLFTGETPIETVAAHLLSPVPIASDRLNEPSAEAVDELVNATMSKDPESRPKDLDALRVLINNARRRAEEIQVRTSIPGTLEEIEDESLMFLEDPTDIQAFDELKRQTKKHNAWGALIEIIEEAAISTDDDDTRKRLLIEGAQAATRNTRDYDKANLLLEQVREIAPDDVAVQEAGREILKAKGCYAELVTELAGLAEVAEDPQVRLELIREIADIYYENLKDNETAFDYFLACLSVTTIDNDLLATLDKLAEKNQRHQNLVTKCAELAYEAETAQDIDTAVFYYNKSGILYSEQIKDPALALSCFQKILEYRPANTPALAAVAQLYKAAKQWTELVQVLIHLSENEPNPAAGRDFRVEAATLLHETIEDTDRAIPLFEEVIEQDPAHKKAFDVLCEIYEKTEAWKKLTDLLAGCIEGIEQESERAESHHRIAEIFELHLDDLKSAKDQYELSLESEIHHLDSLKGLERILTRNGDFAGLRSNMELQLELASTPKQEAILKERLALLLEEEFKEYGTAIEHLTSILETEPKHVSSLTALTRLYRTSEQWHELADVLKTRALEADGDEKKELLSERATIIKDKLEDAKLAAEALEEVAALGVEDAFDDLAKAQEESGDFESAIKTIKKLADDAQSTDEKISLMLRIAKIETQSLERPADGINTIRSILDFVPENRDLIGALRAAYIHQGNYAAALDTLKQELTLVENNADRANLHGEMGLICLDHLEDEQRAKEHFEKALDLDMNCFVAGDRLSELYRNNDLWDDALRIYKRWADASDTLEEDKQEELFTQMAAAYGHLDKFEDALETYKKVANIKPENTAILRPMAEIALKLENFELAEKQFTALLKHEGKALPPEETVKVLIGLGRAALGTGNETTAAKCAKQVTTKYPDNREAQMLLADILEMRKDFRGFVDACERVLDALDPGDPVYIGLLRRAATIQFEQLRDSENATSKLRTALDIDPSNRAVLNELMKIFTVTKQYSEVVKTILHTADLVDDPNQLARYYLAVAKIFKHELKQPDDAIKYYEMALEKDESLDKAKEAIIEILTAEEDWKQLAKLYGRVIEDMPQDTPVEEKVEILKKLADLLISKLGKLADGIEIVVTLQKLEPEEAIWKDELVKLYGSQKDYAPAAVALNREIFAQNTGRGDCVKNLFNIYVATEETDRAWCVSSLLSLMNKGSVDEIAFYRKRLPEDLPELSDALESFHWSKMLVHNNANATVTSIFSIIAPIIQSVKGKDIAEYNLDPAHAITVTDDSSPFSGFVNFVSASLGVAPPPLFYLGEETGTFEILDTKSPVMVADSRDEITDDRKGITFALGQQLTLLHPGFFVHKLVNSGTDLSAWLFAAIKSFVPNLPLPEDIAAAVAQRIEPMKSLDPEARDLLQEQVKSFAAQTADVNMKAWGRSIDYTMDRAGLLLCGDLTTAVRVLNSQKIDKQRLSERLRELSLFSISDDHFNLRKYLDTALVL